MGLMPGHTGKEYDAERMESGYVLKVWKRGAQPHIDDRWIARGLAELVAEDIYVDGHTPWGFAVP